MPAARRSLKISLPPLWLIGLCLFLPTVRACERLESPAQLMWGAKPLFILMLSPYVVAQLLVVVAIVALARGRADAFALGATTLFAGVSASSAAVLAILGFDGHDAAAQLWRLGAALCLIAGTIVLVHARRLEPWTRLFRLHTAYAIFTLPMAALLARITVGDGPARVGVGAWAFLAAFAALALVHARASVSSSTA